MTFSCAHCGSFTCRGGLRDAGPDDCPMRGDMPEFGDLYPEGPSRDFLVKAALVEAGGYCRWTRLREMAEFSHQMGYLRLGIAHCRDMAGVAKSTADALRDLGLDPVLPPPPPQPLCDPLGQARFFKSQDTAMNILAGLCVGHEAIFVQESDSPVVTFIARDTRLQHNPVAALYTSRSYLKDEVFGHWPEKDRPAFLGGDIETLGRVTRETASDPPEVRSRLAETLDLAHGLGVRHVGISFCVGFKEEAETLSRILKTNGFRVSSICCKAGAIPKEEAGIDDAQKVRPGRKEMLCNPSAQGELLSDEGVELALILGQCVGHDAATFHRLRMPALCLVAKDRVLAHNTVAALTFPPV